MRVQEVILNFTYLEERKIDYKEVRVEDLARHEAQNVIPLGNIIIGHKGKDKTDWRDQSFLYLLTKEEQPCTRRSMLAYPQLH